MANHPSLAEAWELLATACAADGDMAAAAATTLAALRVLETGTPRAEDAALLAFARAIGVAAPTKLTLVSGMRWLYLQTDTPNHEEIRRLAKEELELPGASRIEVLDALASATIALGHHDEALAARRAMFDAGPPDKSGKAHYRLARELAWAGQRDEATAALATAVEREARDRTESWGEQARTEPCFAALRGERAFLVAINGLPTPDEVEKLIQGARAKLVCGKGSESLALAELGVEKARLVAHLPLIGRALGQLGAAQSALGLVDQSLLTFRQAMASAEESLAAEQVEYARLTRGLATALHDAKRLEEATAAHDSALARWHNDATGPLAAEVALTLLSAMRLAREGGQDERQQMLTVRRQSIIARTDSATGGTGKPDVFATLMSRALDKASTALTHPLLPPEREQLYEQIRGLLKGYPGALPLSRQAARALFTETTACTRIKKNFLCFVMVPVEERIGEWRFAGKGKSLAQALAAIDAFAQAREFDLGDSTFIGSIVAEDGVMDIATGLVDGSWSYGSLPLGEIGTHDVVFLAEGGAPYDDVGVCIIEIPTLKGSRFARRMPETRSPRGK